jgi:hypothetical protein
MNTLDTFVDQAWKDHAKDSLAVAARLSDGLALVETDDHVARLAMLAHHVLGEHLRRWSEAMEFLNALGSRGAQGEVGAATLATCQASLRLCNDATYAFTGLGESERCRAYAMAACNLAAVDPARASTLLEEAVARASALPDSDAGVRSVAASSNNIASNLRELERASTLHRELMIRAAQIARMHWERAGTWREVERAEYQLSLCWLAAGDTKRAMEHAKTCDAIVQQNGDEPLELFFAAETLALAARALGDEQVHDTAIAKAQVAFAALQPEDQGWCRTTLEKLTSS